MKLSVKQRMAHNRVECSKTGGGRFNKYILSPTDELVANIFGLYASVEGVPNAKSFGVPSNEKPCTSSKTPPTVVPDSPKNNGFNSPSSSLLQLYQKQYHVTPTPAQNRKRRDVFDIGDVIEMEAKHFSKIVDSLDSIKKEMKENRNYLKEVSRNIRELKKSKKKSYKS